MKNMLVLFFGVVLSTSIGMAQENDNKEIYTKAIEVFLAKREKNGSEKILRILSEAHIELKEKILGYDIYKIDDSTLRKLSSRGLNVIQIRPIEVKGDLLLVKIVDYIVFDKNDNLEFNNSGGAVIYFKFNCLSKKVHFSRIEKMSF